MKGGERGSTDRPRRLMGNQKNKEVNVVFHGLRHRQNRKLVATLPHSFMEDHDPKASMAAQYREMKRYDPNWGANNVNMVSLGYVGELGLKVNDGFYANDSHFGSGTKDLGVQIKKKKTGNGAASSSSSNGTSTLTAGQIANRIGTNGTFTNLNDFWAWFESQKYFDYTTDLDSLSLPSLLKTEAELAKVSTSIGSKQGGAKQQKASAREDKKRMFEDAEVNDTQFMDSLYCDTRELPRDKDGVCVEADGQFTGDRTLIGEGVDDSKIYQRLISAFVADRRDGGEDKSKRSASTFDPNIIKDAHKKCSSSSITGAPGMQKKEVVDISDIPLERRTLLEVGAAGLLREGDNCGDWTSFCREMMATSQDSDIVREIRERLQGERKELDDVSRILGGARRRYAVELQEHLVDKNNSTKDKSALASYRKLMS